MIELLPKIKRSSKNHYTKQLFLSYLFLNYSDNPYDIIYNFDGEHVYFRNRNYAIDIAYTIFQDGIYPGPTSFVSDVLYTIDGPYTDTELFLILYALKLL